MRWHFSRFGLQYLASQAPSFNQTSRIMKTRLLITAFALAVALPVSYAADATVSETVAAQVAANPANAAKIVADAIAANPGQAADIAAAAVKAAPSQAGAITTAAINAAPTQLVAIATAAAKAVPAQASAIVQAARALVPPSQGPGAGNLGVILTLDHIVLEAEITMMRQALNPNVADIGIPLQVINPTVVSPSS